MKFSTGDTVMFSRNFLKSTSQHTGEKPFLVGNVQTIEDLGGCVLAFIKWSNGTSGKVNIKNLVLKNKLHLELQ